MPRPSFEKRCGMAFASICVVLIAAVVIGGMSGDSFLGFDYENIVIYTAPDLTVVPWAFFGGVNILTLGMMALAVAFFLVSRYMIGYLWGKVYLSIHNASLRRFYAIGTVALLLLYGGYILSNSVSLERMLRSAETAADCHRYRNSTSDHLPLCVRAVAIKTGDPDLCLQIDASRWSGHSSYCLESYALEKSDPAACSKIDDASVRSTCYGNLGYCEEMEGGTGRDSCYISRAGDAGDESACRFVQNSKRAGECSCAVRHGYYSSECARAREEVL
ncbi:MAG TPA: hypothetical protein VD967_00980 [Candidatus Paceibacterota bacterium]|nr:hypothetical protein [Candidatus Paceibacterota bacterium]